MPQHVGVNASFFVLTPNAREPFAAYTIENLVRVIVYVRVRLRVCVRV